MLGKKSKIEILNNAENHGAIIGENHGTININTGIDADLLEQVLRSELLKKLGLGKELFQNFRDCRGFVFSITHAMPNIEPEQTSCMDVTLLPLLKAVLGAGKYSEFSIADFVNQLDGIHKDNNILQLVKRRWGALGKLFAGNREQAIEELGQIYNDYESNKAVPNIPNWLKINVLIDIRNLTDLLRQAEKFFDVQDRIKASHEDIHFPALDRFDSITNSQLISWYIKETSASPYSIRLGGGTDTTEISNSIFKSFVTSAYFGSLTHLWQVNIKIKEVLFFLNKKWHDGNLFCDYLRACFIGWDVKDKNALQNVFREHFSLLTFQNVREIWCNISLNPHSDTRILKYKLIALSYLGNYMDEETFKEAANECFVLINIYVELKNPLLDIQSSVLDFIKQNIQRLNTDKVIETVFKDFATNPSYMSTMSVGSVFYANFGSINNDSFGLLYDFIESSKDYWNRNVEYLSIRLRLAIDDNRKTMLDKLINKVNPTFYKGDYLFNVNRDLESAEHAISGLLLQMDAIQKEKVKKGESITINYHIPFGMLRDIIVALDCSPSSEQIERICSAIGKALCEHYNLETKICALEVLCILWIKDKNVSITQKANEFVSSNNAKQARSISGEWVSTSIFIGLFNTMLGNTTPLEYSFILSKINHLSVSARVRFFNYIHFVCTNISFTQDSGLLIILLRLLIDSIASQESDIRHYSIKALSKIGASCLDIGDMTIELMYEEYIGLENSINRSYIIDGMTKINKSHPLTAKVLDEAKRGYDFELSLLTDKPQYKTVEAK